MATVLSCLVLCLPPHGGHAHAYGPPRGGHALPVIGVIQGEPVTSVRKLARFSDWVCVHGHEADWQDTGDPYWGGLQMDRSFMASYGSDMLQRHHGGLADSWTPAEQIVVAERAYVSGRGWYPWPQTARMCGLL